MAERDLTGTEIAIVGMAARLPGARDLAEYWRLLAGGGEPIRRLDRAELAALGVDPALADDPAWVPAVSQLDGYADFDADFFGVNPREAESMDPQHRVFLELAWLALEDAGHAPRGGEARVGVFAGATLSTYLLFHLARSARTLAAVDPFQLIVGNAGDSLATRVSYKLGLTGPSHAVQCACSTSLVAVHLACQSLLGEECDLALAGGASINVAQAAGYRYVQDSILSPDGRCRPFDADARGTLFGSGAGVVALRRLEDALADGDPVRAVILGSAVNNDGAAKVGFTAPSVEGQAAVVTEALAVAGADASEISYVECHGTATALGDPIEVQALTRAFRAFTDRTGYCAVGSVKSNFGHLDIAAGVAGLIKTVLALEHERLPATLHFRRPNPKIDFAASPFRVAAEAADWPRGARPRRAGVSAFGIGGTNAHLVLEEAPERPPAAEAASEWQLLVLSARTPEALGAATVRLADHLESRPDLPLADVARTLQSGRARFEHRRIVIARTASEAAERLRALDPAWAATGGPATGERPAAASPSPPPGGERDPAFLLGALGRHWLAGGEVDWEGHASEGPRRRVSLPGYPFQRRRYWVEPDAAGAAAVAALPIPTAPIPAVPARDDGPAAAAAHRPGFVAPRGEVERAVARIWEELLGVAPVGAGDDFYALGGDSLLATQVASRLRELFRIELSVEDVLEGPSVAGMSRAVEAAREGAGAAEGAGAPAEPIRPREPAADGRSERAPASFSQERMWFLERLEGAAGGAGAYGLAYAVAMSGRLDAPAFAAALSEVRRRHQALRTTFAEEDGRPVQVLGPPCGLALPVVDLSGLPEPRRPPALGRVLALDRRRPFDLARGPLVRALLVRLAGAEHVCALSMHHIVSDGWSMSVVVREAAALYAAFVRGERSPLPPLPIQYADYAAWQRRRLQGEVLEAHAAYWSERLANLPPPLELPADRPRSAAGGFELRGAEIDLPPELDRAVEELARRAGATPFMVLLAGFLALLHRYTGETDLVVGAPIANRNRSEVEGLIGFFLNTLVLRTRLDPGAGFERLVAEVRGTALGAYEHQDVPLEALLRAAGGDRRAGMDALFRVMFLLQNVPRPRLEAAGLTLRELPAEGDAAQLGATLFDVTLTIDRTGAGPTAALSYDASRFEPATAERMLAHYRALLAAALAAPERPLEALALVTGDERRRLLAWGTGAAPAAAPTPFLDAFRARVREAPAAEAVVTLAGRGLTYAELDRRSAALAARLARLGVGAETRVGLAVERSPALLVAVLGVLRAGGAYVPLDPKAPPERTAFVLEDAAAPVVLASPGVAERFAGAGREVVVVEEEGAAAAAEGAGAAAEPPAAPDESAAYLIYTSGSTGAPKGVVVPRRALDRFAAAARQAYGVAASDRVLQFASIGFDTSVEEIFPALAAGATLVLRDEEMLRSPEAFLAACRAAGISVLDLPTAYFHELVAGLSGPGAVRLEPPLRLVILGGERVLPARLAAALPAFDPEVRLLNTYGPTEATVAATASEPLAEDREGLALGREASIGRSLPGASAFVVDPRLELAPVGVPGELLLGGPGVARGYLGRPALTAERFVPNPFAAATGGGAGERLYRTGDRVRWRAGGGLEFLGRLDQQVKVRGFRVELGEIEAALAAHPAVREAAVAAREAAPGDVRLVAYVALGEGAVAGSLDPPLAAFAERRLPAYMVPSAIVELPELPHTPSGKVDRRALAALEVGPAGGRGARRASYRAPETAAEEAVARIFAAVLGDGAPGPGAAGAPEIGAGDDFFELGGHSLLLPQVLHRVRAAFDVDVPLKTLYEESTVAGLALVIEELVLEQLERLDPAS